MYRIAALVSLCLAAAACGSPSFGDSYKVIVDPNFDETDRVAIINAMNSWESLADGKLHFVASLGEPGDCAGDQQAGEICIFAANPATFAANNDGSGYYGYTNIANNGGSHIYMSTARDTKYDVNQFSIIIMHELGHALGLAHTNGQYLSIMLPGWTAYGASVAPTVECSDWQQFCDVRGIDSHNHNCPDGGNYVLNGDGTN